MTAKFCETCGSGDVDDYGCMDCFTFAAAILMFKQLDAEEDSEE